MRPTNRSYILAETPTERIAIAVANANDVWRDTHPDASMPNEAFLEDYLDPFVECEVLTARLGQSRKEQDLVTIRDEHEMAHKLMLIKAVIEKRLRLEHL